MCVHYNGPRGRYRSLGTFFNTYKKNCSCREEFKSSNFLASVKSGFRALRRDPIYSLMRPRRAHHMYLHQNHFRHFAGQLAFTWLLVVAGYAALILNLKLGLTERSLSIFRCEAFYKNCSRGMCQADTAILIKNPGHTPAILIKVAPAANCTVACYVTHYRPSYRDEIGAVCLKNQCQKTRRENIDFDQHPRCES